VRAENAERRTPLKKAMYYHIIVLLSFVCYLYGNIGRVALGIPNGVLLGLPIVYSAFLTIVYKRNWTRIERQVLWIVVGALLLLALRYMANEDDKLIRDVAILVLPALLIGVFPSGPDLKIRTMKIRSATEKFLTVFYIVECGIALLEFVMKEHVFGWVESTYARGIVSYAGAGNFRSVALVAGPLENALCITVMMLFYLFGRSYSMKRKTMLWLLGLVAVFCFNARMAVVVNLLGMALYIVKEVFGKRTGGSKKYLAVLLAVCLVVGISYLCGLGERLWETGSVGKDASIGTRLKLFRYMANRDWSDYLWGSTLPQIHREMTTMIKVKIIENFWLSYVFRLGLVATLYFTVLYFNLCRNLLEAYPPADKIAIASLFVLLASSNISLNSCFTPLFLFMLCAYTFKPAGPCARRCSE